MDQDNIRQHSQNVAVLRAGVDTLHWTVYSIHWAIMGVLVLAFVQSDDPNPLIRLAISSTGTVLALSWVALQRRLIDHLERYEKIAKAVEKRMGLPGDLLTTSDHPDYKRMIPGPKRMARLILMGASFLAFAVWLVTTVAVLTTRVP